MVLAHLPSHVLSLPSVCRKTLDKEKVERERPHHEIEYYGYIPKEKFEHLRQKYIDI